MKYINRFILMLMILLSISPTQNVFAAGEITITNPDAMSGLTEEAVNTFKKTVFDQLGGVEISIGPVERKENELGFYSTTIKFSTNEESYFYYSDMENEGTVMVDKSAKKGTLTLEYFTNVELDGQVMTIWYEDVFSHFRYHLDTTKYHKIPRESFKLNEGKYKIWAVTINDKSLDNYDIPIIGTEFEIKKGEEVTLRLQTDLSNSPRTLSDEEIKINIESNCDLKAMQVLIESTKTKAVNPINNQPYQIACVFELSQTDTVKFPEGYWKITAINAYNSDGKPISVCYASWNFNTSDNIILYAIDPEKTISPELAAKIENFKSTKPYEEKSPENMSLYSPIKTRKFNLEDANENAEYATMLNKLNTKYDASIQAIDTKESKEHNSSEEASEKVSENKGSELKENKGLPPWTTVIIFVIVAIIIVGALYLYFKYFIR